MVFKALNDLAPDYLCSTLTEGIESNYLTRHSTNLFTVPLQRTNYLKRSFSYVGANLWASLPCNPKGDEIAQPI